MVQVARRPVSLLSSRGGGKGQHSSLPSQEAPGLKKQIGRRAWLALSPSLRLLASCTSLWATPVPSQGPEVPVIHGKKVLFSQTARSAQVTKSEAGNVLQMQDEDTETQS